MLVKKVWIAKRGRYVGRTLMETIKWNREGWFLFGFLPLYVRDVNSRG